MFDPFPALSTCLMHLGLLVSARGSGKGWGQPQNANFIPAGQPMKLNVMITLILIQQSNK